jgi:hypothetical protein
MDFDKVFGTFNIGHPTSNIGRAGKAAGWQKKEADPFSVAALRRVESGSFNRESRERTPNGNRRHSC